MDKKEFPEPIEALVLILFTFGFIFGISVIITLVALFFKTDSVLGGNASVLFIIGGLVFLIIPIFYVKIREYNGRELFRLNIPPSEVLLLSVPLGLSISVITDEIDRIVQIFLPTPEIFLKYLDSLKAETSLDWIFLILGVVIIASISEEILFRGFLQVSLERKGDITRAVILSSVTWTIIHVNPYWAIQIFITGVVIGFLAWRTNSVFPSMIVHATNNFISLLVINSNLDESMDWYFLGDHISPIVIVIATGILIISIRRISVLYK
ncbi:MAG: CPBP family intramembrane metalloprotease [Calditrichia bacterium]|nr:CPBP family intramembrane metalloprotease [Calditrichia bacterium]